MCGQYLCFNLYLWEKRSWYKQKSKRLRFWYLSEKDVEWGELKKPWFALCVLLIFWLQAGRDQSDKVDEAQAVQDAKVKDSTLRWNYPLTILYFILIRYEIHFFTSGFVGHLWGWRGSLGHWWGEIPHSAVC